LLNEFGRKVEKIILKAEKEMFRQKSSKFENKGLIPVVLYAKTLRI